MTQLRARPGTSPISIAGSTFVIAGNGFSDGPSQPLGRFLLENGARRVTTITHPLMDDGPSEHRLHIVGKPRRYHGGT